MTLNITWSRVALCKLPEEVRKELIRRLEKLQKYFPEMKTTMKIGLTRWYEGLAFQSNDGHVKLMLEVRRKRSGEWVYPTYWTIAHEFMHLAQFNSEGIPSGERATDIYALSRLVPEFIDESPTYLVVPDGPREVWTREHAELAHSLAREALRQRKAGLKHYAVWWETEFEKRTE
jgi:hypothetical protein